MPNSNPPASPAYQAARAELATLEGQLGALQHQANQARRNLPPGPEVPAEYAFDRIGAEGTVETVPLSALFPASGGPLFVYSMMFGPERESACPFCTGYLGNLDRAVAHLDGKASFVVAARSPIERVAAHAQAQGWENLTVVSDGASSFHQDFGAMDPETMNEWPSFDVFVKDGTTVRHHWRQQGGDDDFNPFDPAANLLALIP